MRRAAERQSLRHQDGGAGLRRDVHRPAILGRERRPAPQPGLATQTPTPRHSAPRSISSAPCPPSTELIGAICVCGSGSFVISAAKVDPRMRAIATGSACSLRLARPPATRSTSSPTSSGGSRSSRRRPSSAMRNSPAARPNRPARTGHARRTPTQSSASSTTSTAPRGANTPRPASYPFTRCT